MSRRVIFKDKFGNRLHPRKFYRDIPNIKSLEQKHYYSFGYLYGLCERIEFIDINGYITGEITILHNEGVGYDWWTIL